MKVLIADDEPRLANSLARMLTRQGHEVAVANDGLEAWELFVRNPDDWDVLITDIRMPRLDGLDLVRRIRAHGFGKRVVFISGHGEEPDIETLSPASFLAKPFRRGQLLEAMTNAA